MIIDALSGVQSVSLGVIAVVLFVFSLVRCARVSTDLVIMAGCMGMAAVCMQMALTQSGTSTLLASSTEALDAFAYTIAPNLYLYVAPTVRSIMSVFDSARALVSPPPPPPPPPFVASDWMPAWFK